MSADRIFLLAKRTVYLLLGIKMGEIMLHITKIQKRTLLDSCFLLFAVVIFLLGTVTFPTYAVAEPDEYTQIKVELTRLSQDAKRGGYRHNWLSLADDFYEIYRNNADWNNRAAALYRSAKALHEMANRSYVRKDAQAAASRYEELAKKHPISPLADDSLYSAAEIYQELLHNTNKSKALLKTISKKYAKSDHAKKAKIYLAQMNGNAVASIGKTITARPSKPTIALNKISPQLHNNVVRIVISMEKIASWRAKYIETTDDGQYGITVRLEAVKPSEKISLEDSFRKSGIFTGYDVDYNPSTSQSVVTLKFSNLLRYTIKSERSPARLIIEATNSTKALPKGIKVSDGKPDKKQKVSEKRKEVSKKSENAKQTPAKATLTEDDLLHLQKNLASQLGLSVKTIVIDPGHGGKDPGAMHNSLKEKDLNLDIARRIGNVLKSAGYTVFFTRTTDKYVGLYERTDIARKHNADLFISIHANAHNKTTVTGFETYFLDFSNDPQTIRLAAIENTGVERKGLGEMEKILGDMLLKARIQESKRLANMVQHNAVKKATKDGYSTKNGGSRGAPFHVLIGSSMPSILIEVGYSSNKEEAKLLSSDAYKNSIAEGIANGLHQYATQLLQAAR